MLLVSPRLSLPLPLPLPPLPRPVSHHFSSQPLSPSLARNRTLRSPLLLVPVPVYLHPRPFALLFRLALNGCLWRQAAGFTCTVLTHSLNGHLAHHSTTPPATENPCPPPSLTDEARGVPHLPGTQQGNVVPRPRLARPAPSVPGPRLARPAPSVPGPPLIGLPRVPHI